MLGEQRVRTKDDDAALEALAKLGDVCAGGALHEYQLDQIKCHLAYCREKIEFHPS